MLPSGEAEDECGLPPYSRTSPQGCGADHEILRIFRGVLRMNLFLYTKYRSGPWNHILKCAITGYPYSEVPLYFQKIRYPFRKSFNNGYVTTLEHTIIVMRSAAGHLYAFYITAARRPEVAHIIPYSCGSMTDTSYFWLFLRFWLPFAFPISLVFPSHRHRKDVVWLETVC
jgi:hypothetical protein